MASYVQLNKYVMNKTLKERRERHYLDLLKSNKSLRFKELQKIVIMFGYTLDRVSGSHHIYIRPGESRINLQPTKNKKVKLYQIRQFLSEIVTLNLLEVE